MTTAAVGLLNRALQGADTSIDRLANSVGPTVRQLEESVASGYVALYARMNKVRETPDQWADSLRAAVRQKPLASLASALAVGALIARMTR